ncbi:unnamed protein product [Vitrella brassicaformis CCMP3155]|uniref:Uncharacterized protein n=1 Tax=Vitrella brassicaformis (strain CCMP3155) TaxID=1169540 RepID=A0A0G4FQY8_VITBC|nr:unnamed protein product [Vitrella brassicaformis CCMP3155]|eukprot:CEM16868.1 unnamed protein product [Vitrella brassicaformis CCMP3155]
MKIEQWTSLQIYYLEVELHRVCRDNEEVDCFASGDVRCASESVKTPLSESVKTPLTGELQFEHCKESVKTRERLREQPDVVHCHCRASYDFLIDKAAGNDEMETKWRKAKAVGIKFYVTASLALFLMVVACCGFGCLEAAVKSRKPLKLIDLSMAAVLGGAFLLVLGWFLSFRSARYSRSIVQGIVSKDDLHETKCIPGEAVFSGYNILVCFLCALLTYFSGVMFDMDEDSRQRSTQWTALPQQNVPPETVGNPQDC